MPPTTTPTDRAHRRIAHALFDALERGDVGAVGALYAPDMSMWFNITNQVSSRQANLDAIDKGKALHRRRDYDDRQIHTFDDGFLAQYTCVVVTHDGEDPVVGLPRGRGARRTDHQAVRVHGLVAVPRAAAQARPAGGLVVDEHDIRELCHQFFDAYQDGRVDVLDRILSDDCTIWHNVFGRETTKADNLTAYPNSYTGQRRRTYDDRVVNTFDDGFVIQYTLRGVMHRGTPVRSGCASSPACATGRITG